MATDGVRSKSRVILGLFTFGPDTSSGARITSLEEFNECLDYFQQEGYNEVDTARVYNGGKQEAFTAQTGWQKRGLKLATKSFPGKPLDHEPESIRAHLTTSLEQLNCDKVDIFYLHAPDRTVPFERTLKAVDELHKEGKFEKLGLSNYTAFEVAEIVMTCREHGWIRPSIYQGMHNAITHLAGFMKDADMKTFAARPIGTELIAACRRYGIDIVVFNPLAAGILTGKYKTADIPVEGRFSNEGGMLGSIYRQRYFKDATFDSLKIIEPVVEKHGLTMVETALRWCVHHSGLKIKDGNDGIIIGISSLKQLTENLRGLEKGPLPQDVVDALNEAWMLCKATAPNYWAMDLEYLYDTEEALFARRT